MRRPQFRLSRMFVTMAVLGMIFAMIGQAVRDPENSIAYILSIGFVVAGTTAGLAAGSLLRGVATALSLLALLGALWLSYPGFCAAGKWLAAGLDWVRWQFVAP